MLQANVPFLTAALAVPVYLVTGRNLEWFNNVKAALERYILVNNTSRNEKFIKNKVILAREVFEATGNPMSNAMQ